MKFIHVSDTHLGCEIPVEYRNIRRKDFIKSFEQVINFAIEKKVDFIIHSGDLFDDYFRMTSDLLLEIFKLFRKLKENNIPFIAIKGNHDNKGKKQNMFEILKISGFIYEASINPIKIKDANIYGISEPENYSGEELKNYYRNIFKKINVEKDGFNIFLFHGIPDIFPSYIIENPKDPRILPFSDFPEFDYYAFGHFHRNYYHNLEGKYLVLPGSTERTEISKSEENSKKGFYYFNDKEISFIEINTRPISIYEFNIRNDEDLNKFREFLYRKNKDNLMKVIIRYNRDIYYGIKKVIDNLKNDGYLILEEFVQDEDYREIIEDKIILEELLDKNILQINKEDILKLFNIIKEITEEYYEDGNVDKIREEVKRILLQ